MDEFSLNSEREIITSRLNSILESRIARIGFGAFLALGALGTAAKACGYGDPIGQSPEGVPIAEVLVTEFLDDNTN